MVMIRMSRNGSKNRPFYKIIVIDKRYANEGKAIERVGFFNPLSSNVENNKKINIKRIQYWISKGAKISDRVKSLLK